MLRARNSQITGGELHDSLEQLWADIGSHKVTQTVYLQCWEGHWQDGPEEMRCVGETEWVDGIAARDAIELPVDRAHENGELVFEDGSWHVGVDGGLRLRARVGGFDVGKETGGGLSIFEVSVFSRSFLHGSTTANPPQSPLKRG